MMFTGVKFVLFETKPVCSALQLPQATSKGTSGKLGNLVVSSEPEAVNCSARSKAFQECRLKQPKSYQSLRQVTK